MVRICVILSFIALLQGCAAAAVGSAAYYYSDKREQRQEFLNNFQNRNLEREQKGLEPLDFCTELRRFDNSMWSKEPECNDG